ncbi:MAG: biopolymer transporter ExbD [Planctomycetota bacterium]|nr:MAG: biopolymer transporter ExbD [Planctomycetota bacterium]
MRIPEPEGVDELSPNLTPMIDVVFLLLIFFMLATTFLDPEKEIDIDLPVAESGEQGASELEQIYINVHKDGSVTISGKDVSSEELKRVLRQVAVRNPDTQITIRGDRQVHHQAMVSVYDACGIAGLVNLAVGTLEEG